MKASLRLTSSYGARFRLTQWAHILVLMALGGVLYSESHLLLNASAAAGAPAHSLANSLKAHLSELSEGLNTYMQNHNTASLERVKAEGRETNQLMEEY